MLDSMNTDKLALRPNCLLTRYPLVFVNGVRSLFYHRHLALDLQDYIAAHGYMVLRPPLAFRNTAIREEQLRNWLSQQEFKQFHFVMSRLTCDEFRELLSDHPGSSLTVTDEFVDTAGTSIFSPLNYLLHRIYCALLGLKTESYSSLLNSKDPLLRERFLDHCVELAENDAI